MRFCFKSYFSLILYRVLAIYLLFTISRIFFLLYNLDSFSDLTAASTLKIFYGGLRFDTTALLYVNLLYLFISILPIPYIMRPRFQFGLKIWFIASNFIALSTNFMDAVYFKFTLRRTSSSIFKEFSEGVDVFKILIESVFIYWEVTLSIVALSLFLIFLSGSYRPKYRPIFNNNFYIFRTLSLLLFCGLAVVGVRGGINRTTRPITLSNAGEYVVRPIETAIVLNTPFSIIRTIGKRDLNEYNFFESKEELEAIYSPIKSGKGDDFIAKNIVIFILESFSADHLAFLNSELPKSFTPFLDSLVKESHLCVNGYANGAKSIDAIPSIMASIPTLTQPYVLTPYATNKSAALPKLLRDRGYHTSFFHGAPNGSMGFAAMVNMFGVESYFGKDQFADDSYFDGVWGIWDREFIQYFLKTLNGFPEPFFSTIFTLSSHHPFKVPEEFEDILPNGEIPLQKCIAYTDMALKEFFKEAVKQPWFDNTIFVFSADHSTHYGLYDEYKDAIGSMSIPIIYYSPNFIDPKLDSAVTQQIDIMPTLLSLINYPESYVAFGRDINDTSSEPFAINYQNAFQLNRGGVELIRSEADLSNPISDSLATQFSFLKAFVQQYNGALINNRLTVE